LSRAGKIFWAEVFDFAPVPRFAVAFCVYRFACIVLLYRFACMK